MKEIFRSGHLGKVGLLADRLRAEGVEVFVRNENLSVTEMQIPEFFPAICVMNQEDEETALKLLRVFLAEEKRPLGPEWKCDECGEGVPDSMQECWSCQAARPAVAVGE
ncbi:MAG: DUF2007 domain-containing protein [Roseibacillus sp.]